MPSNPNQRITLIFQTSNHQNLHFTRRRLLTPKTIYASTLCYFSSYFASILGPHSHLPLTHDKTFNLPAPSLQLSAYRDIITWIASNQPPHLIHPFPDSRKSYTDTALLHQAASTLRISLLQQQFLSRLETLTPTESDIHDLLSKIPATNISVTLIVNDLARRYCEAYRSHDSRTSRRIDDLLDRQPSKTFRILVRREIERRCTHPCACRGDYCCGGWGCCVHRFAAGARFDEGAGVGYGSASFVGAGHAANCFPLLEGSGHGLSETSYYSYSHRTREESYMRESTMSYSPPPSPLRRLSDRESLDHGHRAPSWALDSAYSSTRSASLDSSVFAADEDNGYSPCSPSSSTASTVASPAGSPTHPRCSRYSGTYSPTNPRSPSPSYLHSHSHGPSHSLFSLPCHQPTSMHRRCPSARVRTHHSPNEIQVTKHNDSQGKSHLRATRAHPLPPSTPRPIPVEQAGSLGSGCPWEAGRGGGGEEQEEEKGKARKSRSAGEARRRTGRDGRKTTSGMVAGHFEMGCCTKEEGYVKRAKTKICLDQPGPLRCVTM